MDTVIVTVIYGEAEFDLELPWEISTDLMVQGVAKAFGLRGGKSTFALGYLVENDTYHLKGSETLAEANVTYGDYLILSTVGDAYLESEEGEKTTLDKKVSVIGRSTPNQVVDVDLGKLDKNKLVSRNHALIERKGREYYIRDTNSTNGLFVNGRRISSEQARLLSPRDQIDFGGENGVHMFFQVKTQ